MATRPSKTTLRKADVNKTISNKIAQKKSEAKENYKMSREVRPSKNDLSSTAAANRNLSNSYYKKYKENMEGISKLEGKLRPTNKKDFSKSLGNVVSNKGMKNADVKGTVKLAEKTLSNAKQKLRTHDASMGGTKQQHDALKKQVKTAEKNLKSLNKTASKRK